MTNKGSYTSEEMAISKTEFSAAYQIFPTTTPSSIGAYGGKLARHIQEIYFCFVLFEMRKIFTDRGLDMVWGEPFG